jgi:hypothetical protein
MLSFSGAKADLFLAWLETIQPYMPKKLALIEAMELFERKFQEDKVIYEKRKAAN